MAEFNRQPPEAGDAAESHSPSEFHGAEEQIVYRADTEQAEDNSASSGSAGKQQKRTPRDVSSMVSRIAPAFTVVAVVAISAAAMSAGGVFSPGGKAEIVRTQASDTVISYEISVEEGDLEVILYNDFTRRTEKLSAGANEGSFKHLKPGMQYTVAVVEQSAFGERTVAESSVRTYLVVPPVTAWYGVTSQCRCAYDGYFHFTMDFVDENGYFSGFYATLEDSYGNLSTCTFSEDLHEEQRIDVTLSAGLLGNTATFTLGYQTSDPESQTSDMVYVFEVKI